MNFITWYCIILVGFSMFWTLAASFYKAGKNNEPVEIWTGLIAVALNIPLLGRVCGW